MSEALNAFLGPEGKEAGGEQARARGVPDAQNDNDAYPKDLDALHTKLIRWFEEAERSSQDARDEAVKSREYVSGVQWTKAERDALRARGQPEITINYCRRKTELLCGMERKARTDPKCFPRTPAEDDRADAATQALRYIIDDNNFAVIRSAVYNEMLVEGFGCAEVSLEDDGQGGANIRLTQVPWDRLWHDPHSAALDFSDARYLGMVLWMDRDQLDELYPNAEDTVDESFGSHSGGTYDDRPGSVAWSDTTRQRCRVVQCHWTEKGTWWVATFSKAGFLAEPAKSKFLDARGKSACSLVMEAAYVDRENRRYGMVRDLISLQDEVNKRRSKALHLLSVNRVITEQGAVEDIDKARREVARPDGIVVINPGMRFDVEPGGALAAGQFELLKHATEEMQASGPNASMSGTDPREMSGRAILAQQAGGAAQNEPLADSLRMWSRRVYEMCWMAARKSWTAGKWVRVTDDLNATKWVGINMPITLMDKLAKMPDQQRAQVMQQMQIGPNDPRLQQVVGIDNSIEDLDVDIVVQEGIDVPAQAAENFQTLIQLAGMQPGLIPGDVLIAASSLKNKDDLLARMKAHMEQQAQEKQQQAPLVAAHAQADVAVKQAKAAADMALAKEREHAVVRGIHDVHAEFATPPYGAPFAAPPDAPSAPGTVMPMASHASGGLVRGTIKPAPTWQSQLPGSYMGADGQPHLTPIDPNWREFGGGDESADRNRIRPEDYANWQQGMESHAAGGPVNQMMGPDPAGPDDGYITAKPGEYVMQQAAVARYGPELMDALNAGMIDPDKLNMAAAHAQADLRAKQTAEHVDQATVLHKLAQAHMTMNPPPKPKPAARE